MRMRFGSLAPIAVGVLCALLVACGPSLADGAGQSNASTVDPVRNLIVINDRDEVLWNGAPVTLDQLKANLAQSRELPAEPELQLEPDMRASYEVSAQVLKVIKDSNVTKFGFVGNEKYVTSGGD